MADIKVVRSKNVESRPLPGSKTDAGWMKRLIYPPNAEPKRVHMGISEVLPGHSPHRWHSHTIDKGEGYQIIYPEGFEEIYFIVRGTGVVQWKTGDGKIKEEKVEAGDAVFFPSNVPEHQLLNSGTEKMFIVYCGGPLHKVIYADKGK
jgi:mannose-6-phosphate isomerase-like protein (cupin superfamily)